MTTLIIGAGSMGMLVASHLAESDVVLCTHSKQQAMQINANGLHYRRNEQCKIISIEAIAWEDLQQMQCLANVPKWDTMYIMVKQTHLTDAFVQAIVPFTTPQTNIIAYQNGLGHERVLLRHFSTEQVWLALTTDGALKQNGYTVAHTGLGETKRGRYNDPTIQIEIWHKLVINAVINPITAIHQLKNGALLKYPSILEKMKEVYEEAVQIALLCDVNIRKDHWETVLQVCRNTAENDSSMLQDIKNGRKTEIEAINGYLLDLAKMHEIILPANQEVYNQIKRME